MPRCVRLRTVLEDGTKVGSTADRRGEDVTTTEVRERVTTRPPKLTLVAAARRAALGANLLEYLAEADRELAHAEAALEAGVVEGVVVSDALDQLAGSVLGVVDLRPMDLANRESLAVRLLSLEPLAVSIGRVVDAFESAGDSAMAERIRRAASDLDTTIRRAAVAAIRPVPVPVPVGVLDVADGGSAAGPAGWEGTIQVPERWRSVFPDPDEAPAVAERWAPIFPADG